MIKDKLNISLIQTSIYWQKVEKNLDKLNNLIETISNTDIIFLPEMFNTAFCPIDNHLSESMDGITVNWMKEVSIKNKCSIAGTLMINENNKIYNRLVWVNPRKQIFTYDKYHLFSLSHENKYITKGSRRLIINEYGWKICPLICYDLRFPVFCRNDEDYDLLVYLANWPIKRIDAWDTLLKARSIENQCYTVGVNRIGVDINGVEFNGHSKVFDPFGKQLIGTNDNSESILHLEINLNDIKLKRRQMNFLSDRDQYKLL
tara:strand:+ start:20262 stop:21041 length:780 start_codon:yes stop_codon:yes gene_type:complete